MLNKQKSNRTWSWCTWQLHNTSPQTHVRSRKFLQTNSHGPQRYFGCEAAAAIGCRAPLRSVRGVRQRSLYRTTIQTQPCTVHKTTQDTTLSKKQPRRIKCRLRWSERAEARGLLDPRHCRAIFQGLSKTTVGRLFQMRRKTQKNTSKSVFPDFFRHEPPH